MILVFTDMKTYHNEWETNPKLLEVSIVIPYGTMYLPREDYEYYNKGVFMQTKLTEEEFAEYLNDPSQYELIKERAILAFLITMGFHIIFLTNKNSRYYDRLYMFLNNIRERYGIISHYIDDAEDIPTIPKELDYFNIKANDQLGQDLLTLKEVCNINKSDLRQMFEIQIKRIENEI